ncbi:hypothetical protein GCM10022408_33930 [Hymenobacter fastidiosus]|uniref:DUF3313 domain-containing protein n=1 Tax=Hymenobacter fastidiosus TaxID=486264 RepID=A0ABP7SXB1_9BACT
MLTSFDFLMKALPLLLYVLLALAATSCKSAEKAIFRLSGTPISSRLPPLEVSTDIGPWAHSEGALPEDARLVFQRELQQNITAIADSAQFGYAKLTITSANLKRTGKGFQIIQLATLLLPTLLGLPMEYYCGQLEAEVQILNAKGEVIGTYQGTGASRVRVAMYHGYDQTSAPRMADVAALKEALSQIRPQLEHDASRLRDQLLTAGPMAASLEQ